ncbi:conserved hypothetical protein [Vibrio coralliirubri]|uniref:GTP pyrophosphokinase n=1 Tax=Vibrio coralliirubri TaxID=1516159 RepID=UPI00063115E3|nr:hypothetical protein [Vibrio coralliirubri]CDT92187.1 conserved hypothetical protein [Vibrio coralliirubri]
MAKDVLVNEYDENEQLYTQFSASMESLISTLLSASNVTPHTISARVKDRSSLLKKIEKKDKYASLAELTDIVGLRIITHYSDDVDLISALIEQEFLVDTENSIDKRASLDPDRFGYLSLHYVVSLSETRSNLIEYSKFAQMKFEIQIRSILQHTWAELEHDIGYKSKIEIPKLVRRKFSQLAGLLELADDQFIQIRDELESYESDVQETIVHAPQDVSVDKVSIYNYAKSSELLTEIDTEISKIMGVELIELTKENAGRHIKYLDYFRIETISQLEDLVVKYRDSIIKRASDIPTVNSHVSKGISAFYLYQVLSSKIGTKEEIHEYLDQMSLCPEDDREDFAAYLYDFGKTVA